MEGPTGNQTSRDYPLPDEKMDSRSMNISQNDRHSDFQIVNKCSKVDSSLGKNAWKDIQVDSDDSSDSDVEYIEQRISTEKEIQSPTGRDLSINYRASEVDDLTDKFSKVNLDNKRSQFKSMKEVLDFKGDEEYSRDEVLQSVVEIHKSNPALDEFIESLRDENNILVNERLRFTNFMDTDLVACRMNGLEITYRQVFDMRIVCMYYEIMGGEVGQIHSEALSNETENLLNELEIRDNHPLSINISSIEKAVKNVKNGMTGDELRITLISFHGNEIPYFMSNPLKSFEALKLCLSQDNEINPIELYRNLRKLVVDNHDSFGTFKQFMMKEVQHYSKELSHGDIIFSDETIYLTRRDYWVLVFWYQLIIKIIYDLEAINRFDDLYAEGQLDELNLLYSCWVQSTHPREDLFYLIMLSYDLIKSKFEIFHKFHISDMLDYINESMPKTVTYLRKNEEEGESYIAVLLADYSNKTSGYEHEYHHHRNILYKKIAEIYLFKNPEGKFLKEQSESFNIQIDQVLSLSEEYLELTKKGVAKMKSAFCEIPLNMKSRYNGMMEYGMENIIKGRMLLVNALKANQSSDPQNIS